MTRADQPDWLRPCLDADSMRATDRWAIEDQGVPSLDLMETAGRALADRAAQAARPGLPVRVVCGKGNNGGDGLVAARHLAAAGFAADVLLLSDPGELSGDAAVNLERFPGARHVPPGELEPALDGSGAVVDAIFGTGFAGEPRDPATTAIRAVNSCDAPVVAADIASGVDATTGAVSGDAIEADLTVTFHAPKIGHVVAPGKRHTGELHVAPIGIPAGSPAAAPAGVIGRGVLSLAPERAAASTKFTSGQVVVVGGSRGLTGAVCLAATAAIRAGAGYATAAVPAELEQIFEIKLTEVMTLGLASREGRLRAASSEQIVEAADGAGSVLLGPGIGRDGGTLRLAREVCERISAPLVLDADGLNAHAGELDRLAGRRAPTVLTPHTGELARLLGRESGEVASARLDAAREAARAARAVVVHKGDDTIITDGERVAINDLAAPALATAGTGDVLAGMVAAAIARGLDPFEGACLSVYAHARAGRSAGLALGAGSVIASDVIEAIPEGLAR